MQDYLRSTAVIDHDDPAIRELASQLKDPTDLQATVSGCFHWVRDRIRHSVDGGDRRVTCAASDVLRYETGLCYAKSHLLAALLRANQIPCGLVYQRLTDDQSSTGFCLHGLNAVWLPEFGWYRLDPRGNRAGISTRFDPPTEHLAFAIQEPGECTLEQIHSDPLPVVVAALSTYDDLWELRRHLPDWSSDSLT